MEERLYVRELVASKFHDACSSRLPETSGKLSARSEKRDSPCVTVRRIDLSAPKFRVSRRRRADWPSLGYGSDDRGRASPAPSKDSVGVANETTARGDRDRDRRTSPARGTTCGIQVGPSVNIVDRELTRQDLEDVHISPESSRAQSRANTATYTLRHDAIRNVSEPEGAPRTRRVRLDTLQRERPIGKLIVEAAIEAVPSPASKSDLERVRNSDSGRDDGRIESPKARIDRRERKARNAEGAGISEGLENAAGYVAIDKNEESRNNARNNEGIAPGGDTEILGRAEDGGIFCKRSGADCPRNVDVGKIQPEENGDDRSKLSPAGDTSRKAGFPRRANIASRCRETGSPIPYWTTDGYFSFDSGQDGPCDVASEDAHRFSASGYVSRTEDSLDGIDLYRPCLDDLDSILHSNERKLERVVRAARNLSELLSGPEFAVYKLDEEERVRQDGDSAPEEDDKYLNERTRSSILEIELRTEDLTEVRQTDEDPRGAARTGSSALARGNDFRGNYSKNSGESSVFPASDASDDLGTSRDSDKTQSRSAAKARLSESSMDRSDVTTFSNLVPALSSTHTETQLCRLREEEIAGSDRHADAKSRVTSARKIFKREERRSRKENADDGIFARLFRKDTFQATDRLAAYILQDEKQSVERKVAGALKDSAVAPAMVQKLLDHLREAESTRDARQTDTLDILRSVLIKSRSAQGNASDKETFSRNASDSPARTKAPPIDGLTSRAKIDASEIGRVAKNSYELKSPGGHSVDFSECRETRGSGSTARCESTQHSENNREADVDRKVGTMSIDVGNQTDEGVNENDLKKEETLPRNVADPLIPNETSNAIEGTILRTRNNTDTELIADEFKESKNPAKYFSASPAFPEMRENVRSAAHLARNSKHNGKNNSKGNSEAESLKQISDIHSNDDENPEENSESLSAKVASARSRGDREVEAADSITAIAVFENKDDINNERVEGDKPNDARANENQLADKMITQTERVIEAQPDFPEGTVKEIKSEKTRDIITTDKKVLFALSEVSETKKERDRADVSPVQSKLIDESPTKKNVKLAHSATKEDAGSPRKTEINPRRIVVKEKIDPADSCSSEPPRDCVAPSVKSSESSAREIAPRDKQISLGVAGENNSTRNGEIRESTAVAAVENKRGDGDEISTLRKTARGDNERQPVDLTRNYKIDILSSSNSSVSSTLLDHDDR